jgi:type IV secretory pathway VirB4 component
MNDVIELLAEMRRTKEPLLHCAVFIELSAYSLEKLSELQTEVSMELTREKISVDRLVLRQKEGFMSISPCGYNAFEKQFERVLPASSVANLYPFNYSGKTDPNGFYIGKDRYGTNILVDFDRRDDDKTNSNILILGNSGQGKSYLMKLLLINLREAGKSVISLDAEQEYEELTENLGGCYIDLMSGKYIINPLEPKAWSDDADIDEDAPEAFRKSTRLSQHISYLKDFFRSYKDFTDAHIDAIEIIVSRLYANYGITDYTDYSKLKPTDYPVMSDLYDLVEQEYLKYEHGSKSLFTEELLREICLGINSMCKGAESKFFNGHTNISDDKFICFGVKGLMDANKKLKDAMLFNILSYMNHKLLTNGNTVASIDELYLFLTNLTAIEYIRNAAKRVRKKDSEIVLASQNIEDFLIPGIREFTKPLFSIPTHHFLFNPGNINPKEFMDALQIEESEYELIKYPERGVCLFKCGNERYLLQVIAPEYKAALFGKAGGR